MSRQVSLKASPAGAYPSIQSLSKSTQQRLQQIWYRVSSNLKKMRFDRSPFVPGNVTQFVEHLFELNDIMLKEKLEHEDEATEMTNETAALVAHLQRISSSVESFIDIDAFKDRTMALADVTIWGPTWQPTMYHPMAPWPPVQEFREEGDERHTSQFGRFLPVPRAPGGDDANWKHRPFLGQFDMDRVRPVPKMYHEIQLPYDIEQLEPTMDENGIYIDDEEENGRESFGDTSGRVATRGAYSGDVDPLSLPIGTEEFLKHHGLKYPTSAYSRNMWNNESSSPPTLSPPATKSGFQQNAMKAKSYIDNLLAQTPKRHKNENEPIAITMAEELLASNNPIGSGNPSSGSSKPFSTYAGLFYDNKQTQNMSQNKGKMQKYPSEGENNNYFGGKPMHSGNPWRKVSYGGNSFSAHETIHESAEELIEETFGKRRNSIWNQERPMGCGSTPRGSNASLVSRSENVSPMSPERTFSAARPTYQGFQRPSYSRMQQQFGGVRYN